jgi:acetyl-CoA acyltransferase
MRDVVVALSVRTPVARANRGGFRQTRPDDLAAAAIRELLERAPGLDPRRIGDVVLGCAMPEGEQGMNVGRAAVLLAGLPDSVPGMTVNRFCASGLETIHLGALEIASGQSDVVVAGGVESMTRVPMGGLRYLPNPSLVASDPDTYLSMGLTAERLAEMDGISREDQDAFAYGSHRKALAALEAGRFADETVPVTTRVAEADGQGRPVVSEVVVARDEGPRADTTLEALASLKPAFKTGGTVTAGNSSQMSDGAAVVLLSTLEAASGLGLRPLARYVTYAVAGVAPEIMGLGPVEAIPMALGRAGLTLDDMDVIELNEAFAAQSLAVLKRLRLDPADPRVNPNGGAIALGHPLGCSGAKLAATALHELRRRRGRYAMVTMCIGTGMGAAGIFESLDA